MLSVHRTVVLSVGLSDVGVLWPNGWMDQDETWRAEEGEGCREGKERTLTGRGRKGQRKAEYARKGEGKRGKGGDGTPVYRILIIGSVCLCQAASVCATVSASINPLPSDRLRCCDRYIRCQRSLAVKPLNSRPAMQTVRPIGRR